MKNMSRNGRKGSSVSRIGVYAEKMASDRVYRLRWTATFLLVAVASSLLAGTWWVRDGRSSFRIDSPAPRTFYAHSRMRIVDEKATRALREQRMSDIGGVLVRDRRFPEEVRSKLASIERGEYRAVLPESLAGILESLPEISARRIATVSSRVAISMLSSPTAEGSPAETIWKGLEASDLSIPEQNLAFQIIDHVMERAMVMDPEVTSEVRVLAASEIEPVERVLAVGDVIVREGETVSDELALILRAQGYPELSFPWKTLAFVVLGVVLWASWMWWYSVRREFNFDPLEWGFIITILIAGWVAMFASAFLGENGLGVISLAGWAYLGLPGSFAFHLVLWGGIIGSVIALGSSTV
ncbi:MAG: Putative domain HDIG-containing protein, partial [Synergistales bacterium 58_81]